MDPDYLFAFAQFFNKFIQLLREGFRNPYYMPKEKMWLYGLLIQHLRRTYEEYIINDLGRWPHWMLK